MVRREAAVLETARRNRNALRFTAHHSPHLSRMSGLPDMRHQRDLGRARAVTTPGPAELCVMKILGIALIVLGLLWAALCFLGVMMMSRGVNMFTEAVLPALLGIVAAAIGLVLVARTRPPQDR
jgi:hypothetical protein